MVQSLQCFEWWYQGDPRYISTPFDKRSWNEVIEEWKQHLNQYYQYLHSDLSPEEKSTQGISEDQNHLYQGLASMLSFQDQFCKNAASFK
jgi:hypothetical protein